MRPIILARAKAGGIGERETVTRQHDSNLQLVVSGLSVSQAVLYSCEGVVALQQVGRTEVTVP